MENYHFYEPKLTFLHFTVFLLRRVLFRVIKIRENRSSSKLRILPNFDAFINICLSVYLSECLSSD